MAFVGALISGGATILGGLLGGRKGATNQTTTQTRTLDPRIDKMYFGADGQSGLLGDLNTWYAQNRGGLNADMQAGLDHMKSVYQSPLATQGYERMANAGYGLMGGGVAGNPFTSGQMPQFGNWGARQQAQQGAAPPQTQQPAPNLGLSLSNNWAAPAPAPAASAPATPAAQPQLITQDQFRQMYEEEMRRQQQGWENSASSNWNAGFGA